MLNEIERILQLLEIEGHIKPDMTKMETMRIIYGLLAVSGRTQVSALLATWERCEFLRRHLSGIVSASGASHETYDLIKKGPLVTQMAKHFKISHSHAYTVCGTCIDMFKSQLRLKDRTNAKH